MGQFRTLCRLLGRPELAAPPHIPAGLAPDSFLVDLATENLRDLLGQAFAAADAAVLEGDLNAAGVPAARVRNLGEYLRDLYPATPGIGVGGEPVALGPAFRWERDGDLTLPPAPKLGADTEDLIGDLAADSLRPAKTN